MGCFHLNIINTARYIYSHRLLGTWLPPSLVRVRNVIQNVQLYFILNLRQRGWTWPYFLHVFLPKRPIILHRHLLVKVLKCNLIHMLLLLIVLIKVSLLPVGRLWNRCLRSPWHVISIIDLINLLIDEFLWLP